MSWRSVVSAGAVVGLCAGAVAAGTLWQADTRTALAADATPQAREFLRSRQLVCPQVTGGDVLVAAASVPGVEGQDVPGTASISTDGKQRDVVKQPGATARLTDAPDAVTPLVEAAGGLAPGLVTARLTDDPAGEGKGLASSPCLTPVAEAWLLGGTSGPGQRDVLLLMNPTATDSQVDVSAFAKGGEVDLTGNKDIAVPAGGTATVKLSALAPQVDQLAVRVTTSVGLIAAAIEADRMDGLTPMGTDVIVPAGRAERSLVLAAMPAGPGTRQLQLLAPGGSGAVRLSALTLDGERPLLEGEPVSVTAGQLTVLDVTEDLAGAAAAIRVDGDVPVVAGVLAATAVDESLKAARAEQVAQAEEALKNAQGAAARREAQALLSKAETANAIEPGEDVAWFGPAEPVVLSAVTGLRSALDPTLLLTATGGDATVMVGQLAAQSQHASRRPVDRVEVPADSTVAVELPGTVDGSTAVVTRAAGPGQVRVSHTQSDDGRSLTGYGLGPLPIWVPLPQVEPAYHQR